MRVKPLLLMSAILSLSILGIGMAVASDGTFNGEDFSQRCGTDFGDSRVACHSFIDGVVRGILLSPHPTICFPRSYDTRMSVQIVQQFMKTHPEKLNGGPAEVVQAALVAAYPCEDYKPADSVLGIFMRNLHPGDAQGAGVNAAGGAVVTQVQATSAASKAGIQVGDVITALDGEAVLDSKQLREMIAAKKPGTAVKLTLWRNHKELSITANLVSP